MVGCDGIELAAVDGDVAEGPDAVYCAIDDVECAAIEGDCAVGGYTPVFVSIDFDVTAMLGVATWYNNTF